MEKLNERRRQSLDLGPLRNFEGISPPLNRTTKIIRRSDSLSWRRQTFSSMQISFLIISTLVTLLLLTVGMTSAQGPSQFHFQRRLVQEGGLTDGQGDALPHGASAGNLHKPHFTGCATYLPEIQEESPSNTYVLQVTAVDRDPYEIGGKVTYSIVDAVDSFRVDSQSGIIRTIQKFDRDEPEKKKEVYVTVKATDNGHPKLEAVCTIKVKINDINDNHPMFDKYNYVESLPQDFEVGKVFARVSASDIDDGFNGTVVYKLFPHPSSPSDASYFDMIPTTGEVTLRLKLPNMHEKNYFVVQVLADDLGTPSLRSATNLTITVVESNRKPPTFEPHQTSFALPERSFDKRLPILVLRAHPNTDENNGKVFFEILKGNSESTNKDDHFTVEHNGNELHLKLDKDLDFEAVTKYTLTIRAENKHKLAAETIVTIEVLDENDEKPNFIDVGSGSILENEPSGSYVTKVRAVDNDGTEINSQVRYYLKDEDKVDFRINETTGEIVSQREFDREKVDFYQLNVIARDTVPSALNKDGLPNNRTTSLKIYIIDKNDHPPVFVDRLDEASIEENTNINYKVMEVKAIDPDIASILTYTIVGGDPDNHFRIESTSGLGIIYTQKPLDFEKINKYELRIKASDSAYEVFKTVTIHVTNMNDEPPVFLTKNTKTTIREESFYHGCIFTVEATDPDIPDKSQPQNIVFSINTGNESYSVDNRGCVTLLRKLDRDLPNGSPISQVIVRASDEGGQGMTQHSYLDLFVTVTDINDNAPFLNSSNPVVWDENQRAGLITELTADDYDEPVNGPPFSFHMDPTANSEIRDLFEIKGTNLFAKVDNFDRETRKEYIIPIVIADGGTPQLSETSMLTVIIGDENDNDMFPGESKIFMYKYKDTEPVNIGRVYVEDKDDWDLPDKTFSWHGTPKQHFRLDTNNGSIFAMPEVPPGNHKLEFKVHDSKRGNTVEAIVYVLIKEITDEAVDNSGSIRFEGITAEDFIMRGKDGSPSKQDILRREIARILNIPEDNVDVFTVVNSPYNPDPNTLDVRYSAHNSPYYKSERLDGTLGDKRSELEKALGLKILLIRVDECLQEKIHCESSCTNTLVKSDTSIKIHTNTSSFVGVNAVIKPECQCAAKLAPRTCDANPCLSGGTCQRVPGIMGFRCECPEGTWGERCEVSSISLDGNTWAWFAPLSICEDSRLDVHFKTLMPDGLIMYNGPTQKPAVSVTDFVSLELRGGRPLLLMDFGSGVRELSLASKDLADGNDHLITIAWTQREISLAVDGCYGKSPECFAYGLPVGSHQFLNVNGPLQLGGLSFDIRRLKSSMPSWTSIPTMTNFTGCITNLSLNGQFYNLREPSFASGNTTTCNSPLAVGVRTGQFVLSPLFIIIIVLCFLILIIMILAVVFYRRRKIYQAIKNDPLDEGKERGMSYDEDGGGEEDANYNLALLGRPYPYPQSPTDKIPLDRLYPVGRSIYNPDEPDLQSFVQGNKDRMDRDPDGLPFDDVRNYAYEGDGNSIGSLSSLASGTDDGDMNFDFLPSFGPRFKKLADLYGGNSSDDSSSTYSGQ